MEEVRDINEDVFIKLLPDSILIKVNLYICVSFRNSIFINFTVLNPSFTELYKKNPFVRSPSLNQHLLLLSKKLLITFEQSLIYYTCLKEKYIQCTDT